MKNEDMPDRIINNRIGIRLNSAVYPGWYQKETHYNLSRKQNKLFSILPHALLDFDGENVDDDLNKRFVWEMLPHQKTY